MTDPIPPAQPVQPRPADQDPPPAGSTTSGARPSGVRALGGEDFSVADAVGGWRGLVESVAPGLVFVVVFVITNEITPPVVASLAVAAIAVVARLVRRSPVTYALGGVLGVVIGAVWAWRSGEASNYYAWGLWTNGAFALATLVSLLLRRPLVGLVVSSLGLDPGLAKPGAEGRVLDTSWRQDPVRMRRYTWATMLWCGAFLLRLAVQLPLFLAGEVPWLGTARLVMGLPLWALVLWITWLLVRPAAPAAREPETSPGR
ncbi:DUF3159 domain-containing protein [Litorihabitans aurantiacus]|uniref:DUF3159 domain-containing protein n=1 Tax=Litorihabitans aurantiacus TaxID=1930061 RepID=A0AA37XE18_9MICO|nr:DUF3159 domain-containing protein [Litorihabitans aurantiacus]GMA31447.1 hypothetical protein GCM10025875_14390 [Litorihabitans aurantiacus]